MSQRLYSLIVVFVLIMTAPAHAILESDLDFIVGSGSNSASMLLDWNDGKSPLAWGYRWDGSKTAEDMLIDLVNTDTRLYSKFTDFSFGTFVTGIGYDRDDDGFGTTDGDVFSNGITNGPANDSNISSDGDDSYVEGSNNGFWALYFNFTNPWDPSGPNPSSTNGNPFESGTWHSSGFGASDTILQNGTWAGLSFAPGFDSTSPSDGNAAQSSGQSNGSIPEPSTVLFLTGALGIALSTRRQKTHE